MRSEPEPASLPPRAYCSSNGLSQLYRVEGIKYVKVGSDARHDARIPGPPSGDAGVVWAGGARRIGARCTRSRVAVLAAEAAAEAFATGRKAAASPTAALNDSVLPP